MRRLFWLFWPLLVLGGCTAAPTPNPTAAAPPPTQTTQVTEQMETPQPTASPIPADKYAEYEIITLLPQDAIPAIDNPRFLDAATADSEYAPDELVMGVFFNGEARAYSVPHLSSHEIVNDTVGGVKIAVTW